jgi:hypothetical protein
MLSGIGFSRGGLVVGPLLLLLLVLASIRSKTLKKWSKAVLIIAGLSAAVVLIFAYHYGWNLKNPAHLVYTSRGDVESTTNLEMVEFTVGKVKSCKRWILMY